MQETEKYKLKKPSTEDFFNIEDFNKNTDKIEQALKENAEGVEELKAPSFDDSGTVDGINSFTDFLNSVKNKMNIFQFFKNFKAGMKFILHTGMIVDNYATKEKGFLPDATLVTALKEQLDEQNNNKLDKTEFDNLQIGGRNILRYSDNFKIDNSRVSGWNNAGSLSILQEDGEYIAKVSASGRTTNVINSLYSSYYPCKKGDKFVASVWFRVTDISAWDVKKPYVFEVYDANDNRVQYKDVDIADTNTNKPTVVNGEWVRLVSTHTVTADNASKVALRLTLFKNGEISFKKPKLEFGTKVTDWTPAPEDLENPVFDDSGTAEGINSFTDFMNSVKSKMNIFQFYRDFKAGMKYVLHTGRLVNNAVTTEEGFALDARMGKTLQDQITEQNKNITNLSSETYKRYGSVKSRLDMKNRGIYIMTDGDEKPNNDGAYLCISHGKQGVDWNYYVDVYALYGDSIPRYFFKVYSNDGINYFTGDYQKYITNSDLLPKNQDSIYFTMSVGMSGTLESTSFPVPNALNKTITLEYVGITSEIEFDKGKFEIKKATNSIMLKTSDPTIVSQYANRTFVALLNIS